jgi:hypothetical protein
MKAEDLVKPGTLVLAVVGAAALGFAAGYLVGRDPQLLRKLLRSGAGGFERLAGAFAETREELADLWAASREGAREAIEDEAFAAAAASAVVAAASGAAGMAPATVTAATPANRRARKAAAKAPPARAARVARKRTPAAPSAR